MSGSQASTSRIPLLSPTNVRLAVAFYNEDKESLVFLDLPMHLIERSAVNHRKYLQFLAAYITGAFEGELVLASIEGSPNAQVAVEGGQQWYWKLADGAKNRLVGHVIHMDAGSIKSGPYDPEWEERESSQRVLRRETACVFTGRRIHQCDTLDILPQRSCNDAHPWALDPARNSLLVSITIRRAYHRGEIAILATPNRVLTSDDLHPPGPRNENCPITPWMTPSECPRYTLQWLEDPRWGDGSYISENNVSAVFNTVRDADAPRLPHPGITNYAYVLAVLRTYGRSSVVLGKAEGDERTVLGQHSEGYSKLGEDGRISAEELMFFFRKQALEGWEDGQSKRDGRIESWREGVEVM